EPFFGTGEKLFSDVEFILNRLFEVARRSRMVQIGGKALVGIFELIQFVKGFSEGVRGLLSKGRGGEVVGDDLGTLGYSPPIFSGDRLLQGAIVLLNRRA